jgi:protoporphyrin/coproporphyrin ferrochelatase
VPIGFLSDHMEVIYDLDVEARKEAAALGIRLARAGTVGTHPAMIEMIAEMLEQEHEACAAGCCAAPVRPPVTR